LKYIRRAREVFQIEIEALQKVQDHIDRDFSRSVQLILNAIRNGGKVVVTGLGKSLHVGQKIAATMTSTGTPATVLHPAEAMHGDLGILKENDVLLALSYSGASEELLTLLPVVKRRNIQVIAMTGVPDSPLAQHSDIIIPVTIDREACPFNMAPTASTTVTMAMGDALAIVLLEAQGFQKEDYAHLHPGGAIGRALLLRVADIMRTGDRIASIAATATGKDAIVAMTGARSGSVAVLNKDGQVVGIFTDGDLRRHVANGEDITHTPIHDLMTTDPITLTCDQLAVDVLTLYEQHNIDDLLVVDDNGCLAGMIDIQDLPKFKIL
jgi:arabinose-5-phosphate isomerase